MAKREFLRHSCVDLGMVAAADEAVGEIMTALRKSNMHKNTLIVFLSDVRDFNSISSYI